MRTERDTLTISKRDFLRAFGAGVGFVRIGGYWPRAGLARAVGT